MNANPRQALSDARADLAGLVPAPAERDLPSDRHRSIQEFVMDHIQSAPDPAPRRAPRRRLILASALTVAVAATATVVLVGVNQPEGRRGGPARASGDASGREILLAAATTAEQAPETAGTYWHVRAESDYYYLDERWIRRDGRTWFRLYGGKIKEQKSGFLLGAGAVSLQQIQTLPTDPAALREWLTAENHKRPPLTVKRSDGTLEKVSGFREEFVLSDLIALVTRLPAPPKVRAAAFQALATYPGVKSTGVTGQGQSLSIDLSRGRVHMVVDTDTGQVRKTTSFHTFDGPRVPAELANGVATTITAEWTDRLPG
ncbi:CU044_5270 family protein [Micromonospora sp. NPDC050495]|uniref:CU044_5270 family protein n=1 Tax=Micromonospora sp. NPDC050495 TaxID=3154936 RepID=UPI0033C054DC